MRETARDSGQRGQALVLFALGLAVFLGFVAMAIDVGLIFHQRRQLQNAADAAALAGVRELPDDPVAAIQKARDWVKKNGFDDAGVAVTVNTPYKGDPNRIEVTIDDDMPFVFGRVLGLDTAAVNGRAVARRTPQGKGADFAILVLDEHACKALDKSGSNDIDIIGPGGIMVNSDCSGANPALNKGGGGDMRAGAGIYYYDKGGWSQSGSGIMEPEPAPLPERVPDPLANLPVPNLNTTPTSPDSGGTAAAPKTKSFTSGTYTLRPGVYWGGLSVTSQAGVTFEPGIYIMAGGGLSLTGGGSLNGTGVFFYNTYDPHNLSNKYDGNCKSVSLRGSANFTLTGPDSGPYKNIILWSQCPDTVTFSGSGAGVAGVFYTPNSLFNLSGGGNMGSIQIITNTMNITGSADMVVNFVPYIDIPVPDRSVKLVE